MKKNLFYLFAIVFMAVGVTACSSSDDDKEISKLEVNKTDLEFDSASSEDSFLIESNVAWKVTSKEEWVNITPNEGRGNAAVKVSVKENTSEESREANIEVVGESLIKKIVVKQNGLSGPLVLITGDWKCHILTDDSESLIESPIILDTKKKDGVNDSDYTIKVPILGDISFDVALITGANLGGVFLNQVLHEISFKANSEIIAKYSEIDSFDLNSGITTKGEPKFSPEGLATFDGSDMNKLQVSLDVDNVIEAMKKDGTDNELLFGLIRTYFNQPFTLDVAFKEENNIVSIKIDVLKSILDNKDTILDLANKNIPDDLDVPLLGNKKTILELINSVFELVNNSEYLYVGLTLDRVI